MGREAESSNGSEEEVVAELAAPPDPFARLADALPVQAPPSQRRLPSPRRSRPSFSDLAPVIPPAMPSSHPAPRTLTAPPPRQPVGPPLPSVIIADELTADRGDLPTVPGRLSDSPTQRRSAHPRTRRGPSAAVIVALLLASLLVFAAGVAVLLSRTR